ncbi:hypothetical protein DACRYDRAFT_25463 [Dacryopinax primogenitus]|uniref:Uncharacterized protein n=1 Tax=Dacryopinax primogenitus (strain DJM 731) TaxID=1858805 RepID=M5FQ65_DACPD|nr:uncharacterized protein DACRYDRAFT_25463 [Dacryopinax primogenitus]EJT96764.1 hypothetical protein DACRYDRAFT_25463 [Dacryopinax primogenitus]
MSLVNIDDWLPVRRGEEELCRQPGLSISGMGVRAGVYGQAIFALVYGLYCIYLATLPRDRRHTWARKAISSNSIAAMGIVLDVYAMWHTYQYGFSTYDAAVQVNLSLLMCTTCLLLAISVWMLAPLDANADGATFAFPLVGGLMLFTTSIVLGNLSLSPSPALASLFCTHYGTSTPYSSPIELSPKISQYFIFTFDVLMDHLVATFVPSVGFGLLSGALTGWIEQRGLRVPKEWTKMHLQSNSLTIIMRGSLKLSGIEHMSLLWLGVWATKNVKRLPWAIALCVLVCSTFMLAFAWWTEIIVSAIERPREMTKEELVAQRIAFSALVLPTVRMIPRLWLIPYIRHVVCDRGRDTKED